MDRKQPIQLPPSRAPVSLASSPMSSVASLPSLGQHDDDDAIIRNVEQDLPPSYTGPLPSSSTAPAPTLPLVTDVSIASAIPVDFSLYRIPGAKLSKDHITITINDPKYSISPQSLLDLMLAQSKLPPHPQIRITGKRDGFGTDFDIKISMLRYIVRPPDARGSSTWNYIKLLNNGELGWRGGKEQTTLPSSKGGLKAWVARFVDDDNKPSKSFTLTKQVTNWNTEYLEGQIRTLIATTNYKGKVTVAFPVTHSKIVVETTTSRPWYQVLADAFQPSQTRRYEVVTAVWPYAALAPEYASGKGNSWAVKSEMQFWTEWKDVLHCALLERRIGWLSMEDHIEWAMGTGWDDKKQTRLWDHDYSNTERN